MNRNFLKKLLLLVYIVAAIYNSVTIAFHPDMTVRPTNTLISALFLITWLMINVSMIFKDGFRWTGYQLILIACSGVIIYLFETLNVLTGFSGLLFIVCHSPFFGLNIFDISYRNFSLIVGVWASIDYILTRYFVERVDI